MSMISISIKFFGAFRKLGKNISVEIQAGSSIKHIKQALVDLLGTEHKDLIDSSVLASDSEILPNAYTIEKPLTLSILPPVCGG